MRVPTQLMTLIRQGSAEKESPAVRALVERLLAQYGEAAQAILFYGSCFRTGDDTDGLVDLYVLVDHYRSHSQGWGQLLLHKVLPPTVFYLEMPFEDRVVRTKYTVLSLTDFQRGITGWFHSYLWGRFAQRTGILYARDQNVMQEVHTALAQAVLTFFARVLPLLPPDFEARDVWQRGLSSSYRAELRAEPPSAAARLFDAATDYYEQITPAVMGAMPFPVEILSDRTPIRYHAAISAPMRLRSRLGWAIRRVQGKALSVLRLLKGLLTFRGGVDYILWKIERHSGVKIELTPRLQRHPLLAKGVILWRLYRRSAFR